MAKQDKRRRIPHNIFLRTTYTSLFTDAVQVLFLSLYTKLYLHGCGHTYNTPYVLHILIFHCIRTSQCFTKVLCSVRAPTCKIQSTFVIAASTVQLVSANQQSSQPEHPLMLSPANSNCAGSGQSALDSADWPPPARRRPVYFKLKDIITGHQRKGLLFSVKESIKYAALLLILRPIFILNANVQAA